jgi:hypothetical protein
MEAFAITNTDTKLVIEIDKTLSSPQQIKDTLTFLEQAFLDTSHIPQASPEEQADIEQWLASIPMEEREPALASVVSLGV